MEYDDLGNPIDGVIQEFVAHNKSRHQPHPEAEISAELKSCPFCGNQPAQINGRLVAASESLGSATYYQCETTGCAMYRKLVSRESWNTRQPDQRVKELEAEIEELKEQLRLARAELKYKVGGNC